MIVLGIVIAILGFLYGVLVIGANMMSDAPGKQVSLAPSGIAIVLGLLLAIVGYFVGVH